MKKKPKYNLNSKIRSALRQVWRWSPQRVEAIKKAKVSRGLYLCCECKTCHGPRDIRVDHIEACGSVEDLNAYRQRLFFGELQALCVDCHSRKTKLERLQARTKRQEG